MSTEYDLIAHRKWALEFLAKLNPGKPFDGDVFEDADALVAYVTEGRQQGMVHQTPILDPSAGLTAMQHISHLRAARDSMVGADPFNVNTGLAQ